LGIFNTLTPTDGKDSEGGFIREQYVSQIAHSPRFALLALKKTTFGIGTVNQRFAIAV